MTRDDIASIIAKVPLLNDEGIGLSNIHGKLPKDEREQILKETQQSLLEGSEACTKVCGWLADKEKTKTINRRHSSYGLKHLAEDEIGYVTNGAFIAAAIFLGFPHELEPGSINPSFEISEKSLKIGGASAP